jgi:1-acyl-sn-glycerol-3-phosphate acyltransferase
LLRGWLPAPLIGLLTFVLLSCALLAAFALFMPVAVIKALTPGAGARAFIARNGLDPVAGGVWWGLNRAVFLLLHGQRRDVRIDGALDRDRSWLLIANHQSWSDIPILIDVFGRHIPFLRFFLKNELVFVPVIGFACWALDMPFMKRHSQAAIAARPELRLQDLLATRRACEKYRRIPVTVVNYLEGTRFTPAKRDARGSPYRNLLRPKAAGLSFAINAMGDQFAGIIDVTVSYAPCADGRRRNHLWSFLCGDQRNIRLRARVLPVPAELAAGDYQADAVYRERFQGWVNALWARKDEELDRLAALPLPLEGLGVPDVEA